MTITVASVIILAIISSGVYALYHQGGSLDTRPNSVSQGQNITTEDGMSDHATDSSKIAPTYTPSSQPSAQDNAASPTANSGDNVDKTTRERAAEATARILREARAYSPSGASESCEKVTTPAVHKATGTRYNFSINCLPEGWVPTSEAKGLGHYR